MRVKSSDRRRWGRLARWAMLIVIGVAGGACGSSEDAQSSTPIPRFTSTSETHFRATVQTVVTPQCPDDYIADGAAVGVAYVSVGMTGRVLTVKVLEAPTPGASASLVQALRQWQFQPLTHLDGHPEIFSGKVTYYYVRADGRCTVALPSEIDYVGRWKRGTPQDPSRTVRSTT